MPNGGGEGGERGWKGGMGRGVFAEELRDLSTYKGGQNCPCSTNWVGSISMKCC